MLQSCFSFSIYYLVIRNLFLCMVTNLRHRARLPPVLPILFIFLSSLLFLITVAVFPFNYRQLNTLHDMIFSCHIYKQIMMIKWELFPEERYTLKSNLKNERSLYQERVKRE